MISALNSKKELVNLKATDEGILLVAINGEGSSSQGVETTLNASVQTVGITENILEINKKVTSIDIANYSETANITVVVGETSYTIGKNVATTLIINKTVENISLTASEENSEVQLIIKGVE